MGRLRMLIFHHNTKFDAKILIDAEIMAHNQNSRCRTSNNLDFRKPDFSLRLLIIHHGTKFGAKTAILNLLPVAIFNILPTFYSRSQTSYKIS